MLVSRQIQFLISSFLIIGFFLSGEAAKKVKCKTCKEFVDSFEKRFTETENSNYAGGDTSWEEEKLGSYANSEVRFIEILDGACRPSNYECHRLVEDNEEDIERWWFKLRHTEDKKDLRDWLCDQHLDVCCPKNTFGPSCEECPGGMETPCGGHGKCEGAEEKDGTGECDCDAGYDGITCQSCDSGYYNDNDTDSEEFTCKACDKACKDTCEGSGPENCGECATGYEENDEGVCKDIDECKRNESICKEGTYCLNVPGKHRCNQCDKSCKHVCNGPGPSKCAECAKGYSRDSAGICKDDNECEDNTVCTDGTFCENSQGSYICKACHISCLLTCTGPGADGCDECKDGYTRENETCIDVDECSIDTHTCNNETEVCYNLAGTYMCKCKQGLFKTEDGKCASEQPTKPKKPKKKKKKKSKKGKVSVKTSDHEEDMPKSAEERGGEKVESSVEVSLDNQEALKQTEMVIDATKPAIEAPEIEPADIELTSESVQSEPVLHSVTDDHANSGIKSEPNRVESSAEVEVDKINIHKQVNIDTNASGTAEQHDDQLLNLPEESTSSMSAQSNQEEHDEL